LQRKLIVADVCALQMQQLRLSADYFVVAPSINISAMQHWRLIYCECVALRIVLNFRLSENGFWPEKVVKFHIMQRKEHVIFLGSVVKHFRAIIFHNFRRGLSRQGCINELKSLYDDEAPSYSTVKNWFN